MGRTTGAGAGGSRVSGRPVSGLLLLGPALTTVALTLSVIDGDADSRWPGVVLLVCSAVVLVTVAALWWRGRDAPRPPRAPSTSRWSGGRPEERWH
jgi:hypothetical protein